jgi:hypothetical protein
MHGLCVVRLVCVYILRRERELQKKVEALQIRLSQVKQELESTKEAQRIVLDTKESVLRSLLKQNSQITQERDVMSRRIEDLTATVEQLTGLLRNIQSRKQQQKSGGGGGGSSSLPTATVGADGGAVVNKRFIAMDNQFSISGGGAGHK